MPITPALTQISPHVHWLPPADPDRPSLCAVAGARHTLLLDAGASVAHTRRMLNALADASVRAPRCVALTHWHWDHVFGLEALDMPVIAHVETAAALAVMQTYAWDDAALDARVTAGVEVAAWAELLKQELPAPRSVQIVLPDILVHDQLDLDLGGGVVCHIRHVGGDHAADSCVMHIEPDGVLFLGDCWYERHYGTPVPYLSTRRLFPLLETLEGFDAQIIIEGHGDGRLARAQFEMLIGQMRTAGVLVDQVGKDEAALMAAARARFGAALTEDVEGFLRAFLNTPSNSAAPEAGPSF